MTNNLSYITDEPLTAGQVEYSSDFAHTVGEIYTCADGTFQVLAVHKSRAFGYVILAQEVR